MKMMIIPIITLVRITRVFFLRSMLTCSPGIRIQFPPIIEPAGLLRRRIREQDTVSLNNPDKTRNPCADHINLFSNAVFKLFLFVMECLLCIELSGTITENTPCIERHPVFKITVRSSFHENFSPVPADENHLN